MAKTVEYQRQAQKRYEAKCKLFHLRLRKDKDADIIAWLPSQKSANDTIKRLIREYMGNVE